MSRIWLPLFGAPLCLALAGVCVFWSAPRPLEGLVPDHTTHDFGEFDQGIVHTAVFRLTNRHDVTVSIQDVFKECDCAEVTPNREEVPPGETVDVRVAWNPRRSRGRSTRDIWVMYGRNKGESYRVDLRLTAVVRPEIVVSPEDVKFVASKAAVAQVAVFPGWSGAAVVQRVHCTQPAFTADYRFAEGIVLVEFHPELWSRDQNDARLVLQANSLIDHEIFVPLRVVDEAP